MQSSAGRERYLPAVAIIHQTVIAECERCGRQSDPMLATAVDAWLAKHHERVHVPEDRAKRLAEHGHVIEHVVEWFDQDDSSGYVTCSCGFKSRSMKTCWLDERGDDHLKDVESKDPVLLALAQLDQREAPAEEIAPKESNVRGRLSPLAERSLTAPA
jgi:hypothetical protein